MTSSSIHVRDFRTEVPGALSPDGTKWAFPVVSTTLSSGKISNWQIRVRVFRMTDNIVLPDIPEDAFIPIDDSFFDSKPMAADLRGWIKVDTGIEGTISKRVATIVHAGKNIRSSSATNVFTQAMRDAYGLHNKQLKKATTRAVVATTEVLPPMLAQVLSSQKSPLVITENKPAYVQPKYNGVRGITTLNCIEVDGVKSFEVTMYSRGKNPYPGFSYIKAELKPALVKYWESGRKLYLDGELYKHGVALQDISGYARREDQSGDIKLDYMIYDCFISNEPDLVYSARKQILDDVFSADTYIYAKNAPTFEVYSIDEINALYKSFLEEDFEGAMVRLDEPYRHSFNGYHSKILLKMKPVFDTELEIVAFTTGEKGKAAEALMIICQTAEGKKFPVTPAMEIPVRIALAKKMSMVEPNGKTHFENQWLGKKIIIEYDELSKDNVPLRARTQMIVRTWD